MKKILYVEDDKINALIIRKLLQDKYEVEIAPEGQTCLKLVKQNTYDLILMDINLGNDQMDGVKTREEVRKLLGAKSPQIVAVTAFAMPEDQAKFLKLGFDAYISKPIEENTLQALLNRLFK